MSTPLFNFYFCNSSSSFLAFLISLLASASSFLVRSWNSNSISKFSIMLSSSNSLICNNSFPYLLTL
ncbi:hypothetical protein BE25_0011 [Staphylococcus phage vB_SepM_BE25]|nr:hypothetical protein BE25_0011 [Staphylococcus phage vB_SepM_BE25]